MTSPANFYLVGASKAGTTSLYHYLAQHPQVYMSPVKEPNYLADELRFANFDEAMQRQALANPDFRRRGQAETWPDYLKLFEGVTTETAIGEASPSYLWSPTAPANIARVRPDAKILMILRNPIDRAFAQYLHMLSFSERPVTFGEHMDRALAYMAAPTTLPPAAPPRAATPPDTSVTPPPNSSAMLLSRDREGAVLNTPLRKRIGELYPFLEYGLYAEQVKRYQALFPKHQISIHFYEDYQQAPAEMMSQIFQFLEVDPTFKPDLTQRHMQAKVPKSWAAKKWLKQLGLWNLAKTLTPPALRQMAFQKRETLKLEPKDRARLIAYYRTDVENLSTILSRDLTHWLAV